MYGEPEWQAAVREHVNAHMDMFNPTVLSAFNETIGWLSEWACSRSFGLGTRVPWDEQFLIESLSDSTIYMAYYTIAHLLQGGDITGQTVGPAGLTAAQCTDELFDFVFLGKPAPAGLPAEPLAAMRREFEFWYPLDLRVSGKDLINNHLTMALYNHAAVWADRPELWPRAMFTNGHVLVDGRKMSKSEGNFLTLADAVGRFSADATRFACADAGDGNDDANFAFETVDMAIKKLVKELEWTKATLAAPDDAPAPAGAEGLPFADAWFANELLRLAKESTRCYERMQFRGALKYGFHELTEARDKCAPQPRRARRPRRPRRLPPWPPPCPPRSHSALTRAAAAAAASAGTASSRRARPRRCSCASSGCARCCSARSARTMRRRCGSSSENRAAPWPRAGRT